MFNEASELFKNAKIDIRKKDIIRVCRICGKKYKDTQIIIEGVPSCKFAICNNCKNKMQLVATIKKINDTSKKSTYTEKKMREASYETKFDY